MSKFKSFIKNIKKTAENHASSGLTIIAIGGVALTAYFAISETKAAKEKETKPETIPEKIGDAIATYPKTIATASVTVGVIALNEYVNHKQFETLSAIAATQFIKNKKTKDAIGEEKNSEVSKQLVEEYLFCPDESTAIRTGHGNILCYEPLTGHFFYSCQNHILNSAVKLNALAQEKKAEWIDMYDWYDELGLPKESHFATRYGFAFDSEDPELGIQVYFDSDKTPDGIPYLIVKHHNEPIEI